MAETLLGQHSRVLVVGAHFADPDSFAAEPVMLRVVERHSDYHVTVHNGDTGRTYDLFFGDLDRLDHVALP